MRQLLKLDKKRVIEAENIPKDVNSDIERKQHSVIDFMYIMELDEREIPNETTLKKNKSASVNQYLVSSYQSSKLVHSKN